MSSGHSPKTAVNRKLIYLPIAAAVALYLTAVIYGSRHDLSDAWAQYSRVYILGLFVPLVLTTYLHYRKWIIFLSLSGHQLPVRRERLLFFLAGNALAISPGKLGEMIRSFLIRDRYGIPLTHSIPATLADRTTDMITLYFLGSFGLYFLLNDLRVCLILLGVGATAIIVLVALRNRAKKLVLKLVEKVFGGYGQAPQELFSHFINLLRLRNIGRPLLYSTIAWTAEGIGLYIALKGAGVSISALLASAAYYTSTFLGAVSLTPGGIATTEGALAVTLHNQGVTDGAIILSVLLVRLFTLWIPVAVGAICLLFTQKISGAVAPESE